MEQKPELSFKKGDRIELVSMTDDPHPIEPGSLGTVESVFEWRGKEIQLSVRWDSGRTLGVILPQDVIKRI